MWITSSLDTALTPTALALGNFDGLHRGHGQVISPVLKYPVSGEGILAHSLQLAGRLGFTPEQSTSALEGGLPQSPASTILNHFYSTVVTFHPHPQEFFSGQQKKLLTPLDEKVACLQGMGVEQLVLLPFNQDLAALSPEQFVQQILVDALQAQYISVGFDFHFGKDRMGNPQDLQRIAHQFGVEVNIIPLYASDQGERISSSMIRQALEQGNLHRVHELLGRPYQIVGQVIHGQQLGRTLGFPTANLDIPPEKLLPQYGVYAVRVSLQAETLTLTNRPAVMNVGCRPTIAGQLPTVEVYLLDWSGDLYGHTLTVTLAEFLRPERRFAGLEELKLQIQADCVAARTVLGLD
ncbi:MAG: bifunctional riboflavin kinase/FAD synthetase [Microcoleaceae cyanobacterium]